MKAMAIHNAAQHGGHQKCCNTPVVVSKARKCDLLLLNVIESILRVLARKNVGGGGGEGR